MGPWLGIPILFMSDNTRTRPQGGQPPRQSSKDTSLRRDFYIRENPRQVKNITYLARSTITIHHLPTNCALVSNSTLVLLSVLKTRVRLQSDRYLLLEAFVLRGIIGAKAWLDFEHCELTFCAPILCATPAPYASPMLSPSDTKQGRTEVI